jgi:hypothetical protein
MMFSTMFPHDVLHDVPMMFSTMFPHDVLHDVPMMFSTLHCVSVSVPLLFAHVVVFLPCRALRFAFACTPFSPASFVSALASLHFHDAHRVSKEGSA